MSNYTLHKLPEGFIITSHEDIQEDDFVFANDTNVIFRCNNHEANSAIPQFKNLYEKLIAQQDQIDFSSLSEEDQKKIGWFDVDDMARRWCTMQTTRSTDYWKSMVSVYIKGFQKAQELLSDRRFTLEEAELIFGLGAANHANGKPSFEEVIQSLSQPKSWNVELELEACYEKNPDVYGTGMFNNGRFQPKLTNGKIKITKIV
jgi:hypothetical protein